MMSGIMDIDADEDKVQGVPEIKDVNKMPMGRRNS
jgi:hypothetical protein